MLVRMNPRDPIEPENEQPANLSEEIEFLGNFVTTVGFIIRTIGEGIGLSELAQEEQIIQQRNQVNQQQLSDIQSKLDYLIKEVDMIKKRDNHFRRW